MVRLADEPDHGGRGLDLPIVPRPPTLNRPKRAKGAEQVVMLGVTFRMTITDDGSEGMSLDVMVRRTWQWLELG